MMVVRRFGLARSVHPADAWKECKPHFGKCALWRLEEVYSDFFCKVDKKIVL